MKNLLKISILVVVLAACSKNKEITTSVPQQRTMDKTDCSKFLPVDVSKIAAKRPIKGGQNQKVTATAIASYFTGKATVSLSFNIKSTPIVINRRRVADGVTVHLYTSQKRITHYNDDYTWYGNMAGGVAYVGSFGLETPAFVFPPLLYYNLNYVKFATGHEGLHTKGLYHAKDSCNQSYGTTANWMGGNYNFTPEQRFIGESVLSGTAQGCMLINQILTVRNTIN